MKFSSGRLALGTAPGVLALRVEMRGQARVTLTTLRGSFAYSVESTQIVNSDADEVLRPSDQPILTVITCYPFSYVGSAPQRFIVKARQEPYPELLHTGNYFPPR